MPDFFERVNKDEGEHAEGRELPDGQVETQTDQTEELPSFTFTKPDAEQTLPSEEEKPTPEQLGQQDAQKETPSSSFSAGKSDFRFPDVTTGQEDNPLPRPLNIKFDNFIDLPKDPDIPTTGTSTRDYLERLNGNVPNPNVPTFVPEEQFNQEFDTDTFFAPNSGDINSYFSTVEKPLTDFSFSGSNSSSVDSGVVSDLMSVGFNGKTSTGVRFVPNRFGGSVDFGQRKGGFTPNEFTVEDPNVTSDPNNRQITVGEEEPEGANQFAQRISDSLGEPPTAQESQEFLDGFSAQEQAQRKQDWLGQLTPKNLGTALGNTVASQLLDEDDRGFGETFSDFLDEPNKKGISEADFWLSRQLLTNVAQSAWRGATEEGIGFGEAFQEGKEDIKENFTGTTVSEGLDQTFGATLELLGDLVRVSGKNLANPLNQAEDGESPNFIQNPLNSRAAQDFAEEFQDNARTRAFLNELGNELPQGDIDENFFDPAMGRFGEFGTGSLGFANYVINLPPNLVMAAVNKLWDSRENSPTSDEPVFYNALNGFDYMLTAPPADNKTSLTFLPKDIENSKWWQWGLALGGDLLIGGGVDAILGGAARGARAMSTAEELANKFPTRAPDFAQDVELPKLPPAKDVPSGTSIEDLLRQDPWLNKDGTLANSSQWENFDEQVNVERSVVTETTQDFSPSKPTGGTRIKPTEVTDYQGNVVQKETVIVEGALDTQPRARVDTYRRPQTGGELEVVPTKPNRVRITEDARTAKRTRQLQERNLRRLRESPEELEVRDVDTTQSTYQFRLSPEETDPRQLLPAPRAIVKVQQTNTPVPTFENTFVTRTPSDLTNLARRLGLVSPNRTELLRSNELKFFREEYGEQFSEIGKPLDTQLFTEKAPLVATELPSQTTGNVGEFARLLPPATEEITDPNKLERLGEVEAGVSRRVEQIEAESFSTNPLEVARREQTQNMVRNLNDTLSQLNSTARRMGDVNNPEEAGRLIKQFQTEQRRFAQLESRTPDEALARFEEAKTSPDNYKGAELETRTEKIAIENEADALSADARLHQGNADASRKLKGSREKALERFPEDLERQDINGEIQTNQYNVEAGIVVPSPNKSDLFARKAALFENAKKIREQAWYHGTQIDLDRVKLVDDGSGQPKMEIWNDVDSIAGASPSENGLGIHLTNDPEIAEEYARALRAPNRLNLDDVDYLEVGSVHNMWFNAQTPIKSDVPTKELSSFVDEMVRKVFKEVGKAHSPTEEFGKKFSRSVRKDRSIQQYFDQFRKQLADSGEMSEQRVRAFQRDVAINLREQGIDSLTATRNGEEVVNVLATDQLQTLGINYQLGNKSVAAAKQSRKFVDEQADTGLQTTKANRTQSELSLADELEQVHTETATEKFTEAAETQQKANKKRTKMREEARDKEAKQVEADTNQVMNNADKLADDFDPERIAKEMESDQSETFLEEEVFLFDDDFQGISRDPAYEDIATGYNNVADFYDIEADKLVNEVRGLAIENDGLIPEDELLDLKMLDDVDAEQVIDSLEEAGLIEKDGRGFVIVENVEELNLAIVNGTLNNCIF